MFSLFIRNTLVVACVTALSGCAQIGPRQEPAKVSTPDVCATTTSCPACPACPGIEPVKPPEKPLQAAQWSQLGGWADNDPLPALKAFSASCRSLMRQPLWTEVCTEAREMEGKAGESVRTWFELRFKPWSLVNPDGTRQGLITGYYEPVLKGSRTRTAKFTHPVFGPPDDLITVDLSELHPELKHLRLRGRLEGRRLVPFFSRAEWAPLEVQRSQDALLWVDDAIDFFFMQIQGSGQIQLTDGSVVRLNYADQNGHPYRSIGKWLIDRGELKAENASMQGIKAWAKANPGQLREMLNANPSMVFFREIPAGGTGPQGAMGIALTPERSIAIDPRHVTLGAPVWLSTTQPNSDRALNRLMVAQDTGGAIRGVIRADFYWGSGVEAGNLAGKMRQQGTMWVLMPKGFAPI